MTARPLAAVLLTPTLLVACAGTQTRHVDDGPALTVPYDGALVDVRPLPWKEATRSGASQVDVTFRELHPGCGRVAGIDVRETDEAVTVTVTSGRLPTAASCGPGFVDVRLRATLSAPLADRLVRDGSATPPADRPLRDA